MADASADAPDPGELLRSRSFIGMLVLAAIVGIIASVAAWGFLELVHHMRGWVYTDLPSGLGFNSTPEWWSLPVLAIAGVVTALAIIRLPGTGGHVPAHGLQPAPTQPIEVPGVLLAALASVGLGIVIGPEAPLIALGGAIGMFTLNRIRKDAPPALGVLLSAAGTFAALSFLFGSPVISAVILIEVIGLGGSRLRLVLIPGLMAAGIGSLVELGMGSWTGLNTHGIALGALPLPAFARPDLTDFLWTIPLAMAIAVGTLVIFRLGLRVEGIVTRRRVVLTTVAGLVIAGLAIAFSEATDHSVNDVLFSGQDALPGLVTHAGAYSVGALALLVAFKGLAYGLSLGSFRGGPIFPAMFLGAAAGIMASHLPGFELTPAVSVGIGAAVAAALRLPLAAVVLAVVLTSQSGPGSGPLIIVGVIASYLTTLAISGPEPPASEGAEGVAEGVAQPAPVGRGG